MNQRDQSTRNYDQEFQNNPHRQYAYHFDGILRHYMMQTLAPVLPQGKALELGCFQGDVTELLIQHYEDLTVVDASQDLLTFTQDKVQSKTSHPIQFLCNTFEALELTEKYDAIFLIHTLEHLDNPTLVLNKINQWLSPQGKLFLVVPNANAPSRQIAVKMGLISHNSAVTEGERAHGHRKTYALDTLEQEALNGGLHVHTRGGIFFKPLANFQFDRLLETDLIDLAYLEGCYKLGMCYPDLCASIYLICNKGENQ